MQALNEACALWIEQQVDAGIEQNMTAHAIGKLVADEVLRLFEIRVNAETIKKRAQRRKEKIGTNVPTTPTTENDEESEGKPVKPVIVRNESGQFAEGTKIAGPGRPPKHARPKPLSETLQIDPEIASPAFTEAYEALFRIVQLEKLGGWKTTSQETAYQKISNILALITA